MKGAALSRQSVDTHLCTYMMSQSDEGVNLLLFSKSHAISYPNITFMEVMTSAPYDYGV